MSADYVEIKLRLYKGRDDDLIQWWLNLEAPRGGKTWLVKEALRRGIGLEASGPRASASATVDPEVLSRAMEQVMERFLVEMRRVVEAALASAAPRVEQEAVEQTDEGKALLQEFLSGLSLGEEK